MNSAGIRRDMGACAKTDGIDAAFCGRALLQESSYGIGDLPPNEIDSEIFR